MESYTEDNYRGWDLQALAKRMLILREEHAAQKARTTEIWREYELLSHKMVPEIMEGLGITSANIPGVGKIGIRDNLFASVPKELKQEMQDWLRANGYGDLIQGTVNSSTLSAQVRKWIKDGEIWPDDLIKLNTYQEARITR